MPTLGGMTEQTENATRLARPLIRLAKLVGVATSYVGMSHDYHEIEDDVLVAVLKALGIDASNDEAINQSITSIKSERETRVVAPTVLHIVGKESKVEVHGGVFDVPEATITLENGERFTGAIAHEGGEKAASSVGGDFFCTSYLVLPADLPEGYHTLTVAVGDRKATATVISAPEKIELLDDMKQGSLWGWMNQLYSIRGRGRLRGSQDHAGRIQEEDRRRLHAYQPDARRGTRASVDAVSVSADLPSLH